MIWISLSARTCFRPIYALVLLLTVTGCANTGLTGPVGARSAASDVAAPDYVRNLPKSRTGNMEEYTVFGKQYSVLDTAAEFTEQGIASWYGKKFHGRKTSSGDVYDMHAMTAAHKHLPLPTYVRVTNLENDRSVVVKVNDRGPFVGERVIDLSYAAAMELDMTEQGTANVHIDALSTHLVAENDSASNANAIEAPKQTPIDSVASPVEPVLAAVPMQKPVVVISQIDSPIDSQIKNQVQPLSDEALAAFAAIGVEGDSEDGFVELMNEADAELDNAAAVEEPIDVQKIASSELSLLGKASTQSAGTYYIQLGAFGHEPNADALVTDVAEQIGMPTFVVKDEAQNLFKVKMGPFDKGDALDSAMTELTSIGIEGYTRMVVKR